MSMDTDYFVADDHDEEEGIEYVRRMEAEHQFERTTLEIKAQWDSVNSRSQSLSEERLKFTEAAVKLGVERLNFEVNMEEV